MGGGGKGGTTTQTVTIPPEVLARYNAVNARAEGVANTPFQPYSNDPNAFVAPLTPTQQAGIANTNAAAGMAQPYYKTATGMTMAGSQSVGQLTPEQINKYQNPFTQAVADTTFNNLRQQQAQEMQGATGNAIRAGAFGGDRSGLVAANMARQQLAGTAQAMAPIYQGGYQNAVQTAQGQQAVTAADLARLQQGGQQIAGLGSGAQGAALQGAQAQLSAGQMQQQTGQAGKAALYNQFLQEQGYPFQIAQFLANIAEGTGALSGSTTTTQAPGGFFSDARLKENIKKIGETNDGQPIYKYNYKGDHRTQIGLLAQDVEKSHPEAVGHQQGYKTVDYDKATENSEGGAVHLFNARQGFDLGGSAAFDPNMVKEILRRQMEMYQQAGTPGGGKTPGQTGYMPAPPALPSNISLARPATPPPQQPSGFAQAAQTGRNISEGLSMAEGAKTKLFGGVDAKGKPVAGWLDRSDQANALRAAQEAAEKKALEDALKPKEAHGGLIMGRHHYGLGGLPYGDEEATKKGYMGALSYDMPSPAQLKGEQDAMRAGKLPEHQSGGLGDAIGTASKLYGGTKMASAAYDKAASMLSGATPAGELASKYPMAPAGTPMPVARPEGLGLTTTPTTTAATTPATTVAATAPTTEAATGLTATAPVTEAATGLTAAATPVAETAALAAPAVETAALAAPVAEGATSIAELLPLIFLKRGGVAEREHHAGDEGNVVDPDKEHPAFSAIRQFEGYLQKPRWDKTAFRGGYGTDTFTTPEGKVLPVTPETVFTKEDAERDLRRRIPEFQNRVKQQLGEDTFNALHPNTQGALTSVAYNYGSLPSSVVKAAQSGQMPALAQSISVLPDNTHRRQIEAKMIDPEGDYKVPAQQGARQTKEQPAQPESGLGSVKQSLSDAGDYYTKNREHIIPIIAGLGSMLASNRPNLGQAIGEGLVGYGASAADMMKRQADVERTRAETNLTGATTSSVEAQTAKGNIFPVEGVTYVQYMDPVTKQYRLIRGFEYFKMDPDKRPSLSPTELADLKERVAKEPQPTGLSPNAKPAPTTTTTTTTPEPKPGLGAATPTPVGPPTGDPNLLTKQEKQAIEERAEAVYSQQGGKNEPDFYGPQTVIARDMQDLQPQMKSLAQAMARVPSGASLLTPGPLQTVLTPILKVANQIGNGLGYKEIPGVITNDQISDVETISKTINNLSAAAAERGDQTAFKALAKMAERFPTMVTSKAGQAELMSELMMLQRREIDKNNYFMALRKHAETVNPTVALKTGRDADSMFNTTQREQMYQADKEALKKAFLNKAVVDGKEVIDPETKRPMTMMEYLYQNGSKLTPQQRTQIEGMLGSPGVLRYFGS